MNDLHLVPPQDALAGSNDTLVDLIDGLLDHGVAIRGEIWLTVADVDLVFLGLDLVLASPETMRPTGAKP